MRQSDEKYVHHKYRNVVSLTAVLLVMISLVSCMSTKPSKIFGDTKPVAQYKWDTVTNIDSLLNIQGYYYNILPRQHYVDGVDSSYIAWDDIDLVFYKDGTCVSFKFDKDSRKYEGLYVPELTGMISKRYGKAPVWTCGGIYKIEGDTLTVDIFERTKQTKFGGVSPTVLLPNPGLNLMFFVNKDNWVALERRKFIIEDKTTLHLVEFSNANYHNVPIEADAVYKFVPIDVVPSRCEADIRKEKWMWAYKEDYEAHKQELKAYKRELKARQDSIKRVSKTDTENL